MNFMFRALVVGLASVASAVPVQGQTRIIIGRVTDSVTTRPVITGEVVVLGTDLKAPIKEDGSFVLSAPMREITLGVKAKGFRDSELVVSGDQDLVSMKVARDYFELDAVVVSGQATGVGRRNLANAIGQVSEEDLAKSPPQNMEQALKGKVPGAEMRSTGVPGGQVFLRLRGVSTILGRSTPLFIVDGVTVSSIDDINPNDVASIEVLKGASAGAMYGSKGSNGVIIIKTKRGSYR